MDGLLPGPGERWGFDVAPSSLEFAPAVSSSWPSPSLSLDVSESSSAPSPICLGVLLSLGLALWLRELRPPSETDSEGVRTEASPRVIPASAESRREKKDARLGERGGNETGGCLGEDDVDEPGVRRRDAELDGILESDLLMEPRHGLLLCNDGVDSLAVLLFKEDGKVYSVKL